DSCATESGHCFFEVVQGCGECTIDASCPAELVCDTPILGTISSVAETDTFCFCVTEGEIIRVSVIEQAGSGPNFNPVWRLLDANDNPAQDCGAALITAVFDDCGPLPAAGSPYRLVIEDSSRNDVGTYKANLQRLLPEVVCDDIALECNIPTTASIPDAADEDLVHFNVEGCEMVRISVVEAVGSLANFGPTWRIIDGGGHPSRSCGDFATAVDRDCGPLCPGGNPYRVEIEDSARNEIGDYSVILQRLTTSRSCEGETIQCGLAVERSIDTIGDSDLLNFRVADGEIIRVSLAEPPNQPTNFNPSWRLIDGDGFPAVSCGAFATTVTGADCGPLLSSRNPYRLEIQDGTRNDTGIYLAAYDRLPAHLACGQVELQCGVSTAGTTDSLVDIDLFSFSAPEGEVVRILVLKQSGGTAYGPNWRLIDGSGRPAPFCGTVTTSTSLDCGPLPAALGPYRVDIEDASHNDLGSYTVTATFLTTGCP
ncbi:MAG: hypothetical protein Q7R41_20755, partial [Phycisphaerales bacterium]|nr:hypothetical protein [Phycisphaerales bacterium]